MNAIHAPTTLWDGDLKNRDGWGAYLGTEAVLDLWVKGLSLPRVQHRDWPQNLRRIRWSTLRDSTEVQFYVRSVGGHEWPQHLGNAAQPTAEVLWQFFDHHRRHGRLRGRLTKE